MKALDELNFPEDLKYTKDHEWAKTQDDTLVIGLSDYAQDQLGEIVFVELPEPGDRFSQGDEFGSVESVKAVSEIYLPVGGEILEINEDLEEAPELVNNECYTKGWLVKIKPEDPSEMNSLMDLGAYLEMLKG
ncbi:MAG: glycine cleavage system protein GcvH [Desulfobacter sp.]|nr:glycine cleavage system protein GcvH [Desulfobacter sp.]WDP86237.1 MAG: glycine cleavage system protein GcvH [Desulfobacter sp.]